jgi:8-oxo-dGTP pyrophosphatase MutT (NUDIX family)
MTNEKSPPGAHHTLLTCGRIEAALKLPLPGRTAQIQMAPVPRPLDPPAAGDPVRRAGVLLLLYGAPDGRLCLVLTRRTEEVAAHKGQVSFPGGAVESGDASTQETALRETCEEIGVCGQEVRFLGSLTPVYIAPSNFCVHPHVARLPQRPPFVLQPSEVAELLEVPVDHFLGGRNRGVEDRIIRGMPVRVPYFDVFGHKVWGATAMVLAEFAAVLRTAG